MSGDQTSIGPNSDPICRSAPPQTRHFIPDMTTSPLRSSRTSYVSIVGPQSRQNQRSSSASASSVSFFHASSSSNRFNIEEVSNVPLR